MRKFLLLFLMFCALLSIGQDWLGCVAEAQGNLRKKSSVMLIVNNLAQTKYDEKLTAMMNESLHKKIDGIYNELEADAYLPKFAGHSFEQAESKELIDLVHEATELDYLIYVELQPFAKKTNYNLVYYDKAMTANLLLRLIDARNGKEIYQGKYTIEAKDSTDYWFIGSGSVAKKALESVLFKAGEAISVHLPL